MKFPSVPQSSLVLVLGISIVACNILPTPTPHPIVQIEMTGSDSMEWLARTLASAYSQQKPYVQFTIRPTNSDNGVRAANEISGTIGLVARAIKPNELNDTRAVVVARDGVAVIVNKTNPINAITRAQLVQVFAGEIPTWPLGPSQGKRITVISRESGSGTRDAFETMVMQSTRVTRTAMLMPNEAAVVDYVARNADAIAYTSMGALTPDIHALSIDDIPLTAQTVEAKQYPFIRTLSFVVPISPTLETQAFIDFALSGEGQRIIGQKFGKAQ
ncbi:MAG: phosphate ABC transporter substrate-binding protein [Chloroflexi bacterium]|nr:phosphate ABC transporter substrate-binding protein [Chloroflexota bacterium]